MNQLFTAAYKHCHVTSILTKVGNGRHVDVRAWPRPSRSAWAENIVNAWPQSHCLNQVLKRQSNF